MLPLMISRFREFLRSRGQHEPDPWSNVVVVFTCPDRDLRRLDVARGPCIARPGTKRLFVGVTRQEPGVPEMFDELAAVLVPGCPTWQAMVEHPPGRLFTFGDELVCAMADLNREVVRRVGERPADYPWIFEPERDVFARWMPRVVWDTHANEVPQEATRLGSACGWARTSQERHQHLYCWAGPGFNPWITPERIARLEAYVEGLQAKRSRT